MIKDFVTPLKEKTIKAFADLPPTSLGNFMSFYKSSQPLDLRDFDLAVVAVREGREAVGNEGCAGAADLVRDYLYRLTRHSNQLRVIDLGDILPGETVNDTYIALSKVVDELISNKVVPIIIGGGQDLTYGQFLGYKYLDQFVNLVVVDERIDIDDKPEDHHSQNFLLKIFTDQPNYLFNFSQVGYQAYYVDYNTVEILEKLHFDCYRLGDLRKNLEEVEPIVRDADMLSFDISAVRFSDAPGNGNASPHGFFGEEACQIVRYAGLSDKLTSIGFYEINNDKDPTGQTAHLAAHMIWYFIEGFYHRKNDAPVANEEEHIKYIVHMKEEGQELVFLKSRRSDRWWMQLPTPSENSRYKRHQLIPCSIAEYNSACRSELPERWIRAYQKMS